MSLNINIDKYGNMAVVPIRCGNITGTAFFVSDDLLLTATHVISSCIDDTEKYNIKVYIMDEWVECDIAYNFLPADVVLLRCSKANNGGYKLNLLVSDCLEGEELKIVGFPQEIGNGVDYFGVDIRNSRHLKKNSEDDISRGFNVVVIRTDELGFASYCGFSGSPVLNVNGEVVGIATDQFYNTLGYTSVKIINGIRPFDNFGISIYSDCRDMSPFGLGTAWAFSSDKIKNAGDRYSPQTHVNNDTKEEMLRSFCCIGVEEKRTQLYELCQNVYERADGKLKSYLSDKTNGSDNEFQLFLKNRFVTYDLKTELEILLYTEDEGSGERILLNPLRKDIEKAYNLSQDVLNDQIYESVQFLYVYGNAGQGKTHSLCRLIDEFHSQCAFYLFYGTDFSDKHPIETILASLRWKPDSFEKLDQYVKSKEQYAIFIIDAVNEGVGTNYWLNNLSSLVTEIKKYDRIKLILSFRTMASTDILEKQLKTEWEKLEINGFENSKEAIQRHFDYHGIQENADMTVAIPDFHSPLFLKIFCEVYYDIPRIDMHEYKRTDIYRAFLNKRNRNICLQVDEDVERQITSKYIETLAKVSVNENYCMDVPRERARKIADSICRYRLWSRNLMNVLLKENLLKEYSIADKKRNIYKCIGFEYDSMGDSLKASYMLSRGDRFVIDYLLRVMIILQERKKKIDEYNYLPNVFTFLLAEWRPQIEIWERLLVYDDLRKCFMQGLYLRRDEENYAKKINSLAEKIVRDIPDYLDPRELLDKFRTYKHGVLDIVFGSLMKKSLAKRDEEWTTKVNNLQRHHGIIYRINDLYNTENGDYEKLSELICWMLTSSFQSLRVRLVMFLRDIFKTKLDLIKANAEKFLNVNDPYIQQGLYAAAYAALVQKRDIKVCKEVAEYIRTQYYNSRDNAPVDLVVRHWTMKIVELASILDNTYTGWTELLGLLPLSSVKDPFKAPKYDETKNNKYFGDTPGAQKLHNSLFLGDFNWYIVGLRSYNYSDTFVNPNRTIDETTGLGHGCDVNLNDVIYAIAILIKEKYCYSDILGEYDKTISNENRFDQTTERIGKKYQWLGYFEVLSYLCDHYKILLDKWSSDKRFAEHSLPWFTGAVPFTDPTIEGEENLSVISYNLFDNIDNDFKIIKNENVWVEDDSILPSLHFIIKDRSEHEWVILKAFDTQTEYVNNNKCSASVWYDTVFVLNNNSGEFEKWANTDNNMKQDFYNSGDYNYQWNDYPCASNYKERQHYNNYKEEWGIEYDVKKTYSTQLQEDFMGCYAQAEYLREAHSPCETIMRHFGLHNAERGVVRDGNNEIVALNINSTTQRMSGLAIKKEILDRFLNETGQTMFYFISCIKNVRANTQLLEEKRFDTLYRYGNDEVKEIACRCYDSLRS